MNTVIMKMSNAYDYQNIAFNSFDNMVITVDCRDLDGTRGYLDDTSKSVIRERINPLGYKGVHFIDSGNYHYLSLLFMEQIKEDFDLVLFDNHSDDQEPALGDVTSCGGWVKEAKEKLPHLKDVYRYGVDHEPDSIESGRPIYISIDKDILWKREALTDWDQGEMHLSELIRHLVNIYSFNIVLGVDICGESEDEPESSAKVNENTNRRLHAICSEFSFEM